MHLSKSFCSLANPRSSLLISRDALNLLRLDVIVISWRFHQRPHKKCGDQKKKITVPFELHESLLENVKKIEMMWFVTRSPSLAKTVLKATVLEERRRERRKGWKITSRKWTGVFFSESQSAAHDRNKWQVIVRGSSVVPLQTQVLSRGWWY